jgi:alpha-glucosidase (family GH31 glycosyl hydrolase)
MTYEWSDDLVARDVDTQFMWGRHLLFSPIVVETPYNSRSAYFPRALWYDYFTRALAFEGPVEAELQVSNTSVPIHIRGGAIVPTQEPALNTMMR